MHLPTAVGVGGIVIKAESGCHWGCPHVVQRTPMDHLGARALAPPWSWRASCSLHGG